jgi:glutamate formiminotransferase / formiminotetrahydrofolate cyclodeaminase
LSKVIECVPNFSEGKRREIVEALSLALTGVPGVALLNCTMDPSHNRCVISVAGEPKAVSAGIIAAVGKAVELIDLRHHEGQHPRMGSTDVIPIIPISGISMEECIELSAELAQRIAAQYGIPTYLYELSARVPARRDLAAIRKGGFERIRAEIGKDPRRRPDFGPCEVHPSAGVTAIGARAPLIAFNVFLKTKDLKVAQAIAKAVRFSSGGLRNVKALGFEIAHRGQVQVSMNLTDFKETPIFRAFDSVCAEAQRHGVAVASSEIIGLAPQAAIDDCAGHYLRLDNFSSNQILENRLEALLHRDSGMEEYLASVAAPEAVPGGGNVAALAGALAAALGEMTASLTERKSNCREAQLTIKEARASLVLERKKLVELAREDAIAYQAVIDAYKLPKDTMRNAEIRRLAVEQAMRRATEIPLRTAHAALNVLQLLQALVNAGSKETRSDAATGAQLAYAAVKGSQYAILFNTAGLQDKELAESCLEECSDIVSKAQAMIQSIDISITSR